MLPGKKDDKNVQQKLLSVTKSLRSETLLRREMENHCKKLQNEKLVSHNLNSILLFISILQEILMKFFLDFKKTR